MIPLNRTPLDRFNCEQVFKRLDDYLDRELSPDEMRSIEEHLEICAWCASTYQYEAEVLEAVRKRVQRITAPSHLMAKISGALAKTSVDGTD